VKAGLGLEPSTCPAHDSLPNLTPPAYHAPALMSKLESQPKIELKAVILAAGTKSGPGDRPMVLQRLGDRTILEYVLANARQVVSADNLYLVVGERQEEVRTQLGD
jgi:hypothetical protein